MENKQKIIMEDSVPLQRYAICYEPFFFKPNPDDIISSLFRVTKQYTINYISSGMK